MVKLGMKATLASGGKVVETASVSKGGVLFTLDLGVADALILRPGDDGGSHADSTSGAGSTGDADDASSAPSSIDLGATTTTTASDITTGVAEPAPINLRRIGDLWWFSSSPAKESNLFVSAGVDHVMYSGDNFGIPYYKEAVERKYRGNRTAWAEASVGRLFHAGFNTLASWSSSACPDCWETDGAAEEAARRHGMYYTPIIDFSVRFNKQHNTTGFPDVFDPKFNESAWNSARLVCAPRVTDDNVLGYFLDNENSCPPTPQSALPTFLALSVHTPGYKAAWTFKSRNRHLSDTDLSRNFSHLVATQYFKLVSKAIRHFDPAHLILGCKFMAVDGLAPLLSAAAPYVDAHALDIYAFTPGVHFMRSLYESGGGLPFTIAEFGFQSRKSNVNSSIHPAGAGPVMDNQLERAAACSNFVNKALQLEFVVGYHFYQYTDQPRHNYGIVSINDTQYTEVLEAMNHTNRNGNHIHAAGETHCALNTGIRTAPFQGSIVHNASGKCLVADSAAERVELAPCPHSPAAAPRAVWEELPNGRLRHIASLKCLDIDRSVSQSTGLRLVSNCSTHIDSEIPAAWEHGSDCLLMNFCRWLGTPVCAYEQTCLGMAPGTNEVRTWLCDSTSPALVWGLIYSEGAPVASTSNSTPRL
jgi:agarase